MAGKLLSHGWKIFTVDSRWYEPASDGFGYRKDDKLSGRVPTIFKLMKSLSLLFGAILFLSTLAVHAATSDDMLIYSDRFDNGWGDGWSWMTRYATNNPVYTNNSVFAGSNSMALVPSAHVSVWLLKALHHRGRDPLHESDFLDQWRGDRWTKYLGQRRVERLKFGTSFSFSDGADELMEASHHFSRRARRQQDQPDRLFDLATALRPTPSSLMICD